MLLLCALHTQVPKADGFLVLLISKWSAPLGWVLGVDVLMKKFSFVTLLLSAFQAQVPKADGFLVLLILYNWSAL